VRRALGDAPGVQVVVTGMGQAAARAAAEQWVPRVRAVVVCGVAGGTGGAAGAGDVVVATVDPGANPGVPVSAAPGAAGPRSPVLLGDAAARLPDGLDGAVAGVIASTDAPADSAAERAELLAAGALAVETEAAAWAEAAAAHGIPLTVVRAVLDTPSRPLGPLAQLIAAGGTGPEPRRVLRLILQPGAWLALLRTGRLARRCEQRAASAVAALCER
jgi:nucleoside phosphorylase